MVHAQFASEVHVEQIAQRIDLSTDEVTTLCSRFLELGVDERHMVNVIDFMNKTGLRGNGRSNSHIVSTAPLLIASWQYTII